MQTLVDKINEQIEIFQTNANLEISKLMKEFRKESVEASK